ncbi:hypothetical protein N9W79_02545 [bacterium]|nr:hypothetical protein [bacterium]
MRNDYQYETIQVLIARWAFSSFLLIISVGITTGCGDIVYEASESHRSLTEDPTSPIDENSLDAVRNINQSIYISTPYSEPHAGTALYVPGNAFSGGSLAPLTFALESSDYDTYAFADDFNQRFELDDDLIISEQGVSVKVICDVNFQPAYYFNLMFDVPTWISEQDHPKLALVYESNEEHFPGYTIRTDGIIPFSSRKVQVVDSKVSIDIWRFGTYTLVILDQPLEDEYMVRHSYYTESK